MGDRLHISPEQLPSGETDDTLHVLQNSLLYYCSSLVSMPYFSLFSFQKHYCRGRIRIGDITRIIRLKSKKALLIRKTCLFYSRLYVLVYFFVKALFLRTLYDHNVVFQVDKSLGGFAVNDQFEAGFPDGIIFFPPWIRVFEYTISEYKYNKGLVGK